MWFFNGKSKSAVAEPPKSQALAPKQRRSAVSEPDEVPTDISLPVVYRSQKDHLTDEQRGFVLRLLAEFRTYREIQAAMKEQFGFDIHWRNIAYYATSLKWGPAIRAARVAFLSKTLSVPIANKMVRMERLERLYHGAIARNHTVEAGNHLKAAREEMEQLEQRVDRPNIYVNQWIAYADRTELEKKFAALLEKAKQLEVLHGASDGVSEARPAVREGEVLEAEAHDA